MKYKPYIALFLVTLVGIILLNNNSQESNKAATKNISETLEKRPPQRKMNNNEAINNESDRASKSKLTVTANTPRVQNKTKEIKTDEIKTDKHEVTEVEATTPEPENNNADMAATGDYAGEVNLPEVQDNCIEPCDDVGKNQTADGSKANVLAVGEFADQINPEAIVAQAQQKDPNLPLEGKISDVSKNSSPPTELGAYSPPQ
ncbi:MAG: hypothetical protein EOO52_07490 [Gammaproteobacteria bacterium]|nr:MAG: hypothetical protein EOO52_07490 [Gammaproteobacteria bacterium]